MGFVTSNMVVNFQCWLKVLKENVFFCYCSLHVCNIHHASMSSFIRCFNLLYIFWRFFFFFFFFSVAQGNRHKISRRFWFYLMTIISYSNGSQKSTRGGLEKGSADDVRMARWTSRVSIKQVVWYNLSEKAVCSSWDDELSR
jgi:hypothetical protein